MLGSIGIWLGWAGLLLPACSCLFNCFCWPFCSERRYKSQPLACDSFGRLTPSRACADIQSGAPYRRGAAQQGHPSNAARLKNILQTRIGRDERRCRGQHAGHRPHSFTSPTASCCGRRARAVARDGHSCAEQQAATHQGNRVQRLRLNGCLSAVEQPLVAERTNGHGGAHGLRDPKVGAGQLAHDGA